MIHDLHPFITTTKMHVPNVAAFICFLVCCNRFVIVFTNCIVITNLFLTSCHLSSFSTISPTLCTLCQWLNCMFVSFLFSMKMLDNSMVFLKGYSMLNVFFVFLKWLCPYIGGDPSSFNTNKVPNKCLTFVTVEVSITKNYKLHHF